MAYCCESMKNQLTSVCPDGHDECPDRLIHRSTTYGIIIHDGGSSKLGISFCPWCGANLADFAEPPDVPDADDTLPGQLEPPD